MTTPGSNEKEHERAKRWRSRVEDAWRRVLRDVHVPEWIDASPFYAVFSLAITSLERVIRDERNASWLCIRCVWM